MLLQDQQSKKMVYFYFTTFSASKYDLSSVCIYCISVYSSFSYVGVPYKWVVVFLLLIWCCVVPHRAPSHPDCSLWNQHVAWWSLNLVISLTHSICPVRSPSISFFLSLITLGQWIKQSLAQTSPQGSWWAFVFSTTYDDRPVSLLHQDRSPVS